MHSALSTAMEVLNPAEESQTEQILAQIEASNPRVQASVLVHAALRMSNENFGNS